MTGSDVRARWQAVLRRFAVEARALPRRLWTILRRGTALTWLHRMWLTTSFVIGVLVCYAIPPFQTNDEYAHWVHMWGIAYGHVLCGGDKPAAVTDFVETVHAREVRLSPEAWRWQYMRDALRFEGGTARTTFDSTACNYLPLAYIAPGLVARLVGFGLHGVPRPGSVLRAVFAARLTNWILLTLAVLLVCRRLPWCRNFTLFLYSIPEVMQQCMAINTDSFLLVCAGLILLLLFGARATPWRLIGLGVVVAAMTATKIVYAPFVGLGLIMLQRLVSRHGWRLRDVTAMLVAIAIAGTSNWLWLRYQVVSTPPSPPDVNTLMAQQQVDFLKAHPEAMWSVFHYQWEYLFGEELLKGSWVSILGAFGWSAFTMTRHGYQVMLVAGCLALVADAFAGQPAGVESPSLWGWLMVLCGAVCILVTVAGVVLAMYIYFTGGYLGKVGGPDAIGVQGRYYLVPIWLWAALLLFLVRRRRPLSPRWSGYPAIFVSAAALCCAAGGGMAIETLLIHFYWYIGVLP